MLMLLVGENGVAVQFIFQMFLIGVSLAIGVFLAMLPRPIKRWWMPHNHNTRLRLLLLGKQIGNGIAENISNVQTSMRTSLSVRMNAEDHHNSTHTQATTLCHNNQHEQHSHDGISIPIPIGTTSRHDKSAKGVEGQSIQSQIVNHSFLSLSTNETCAEYVKDNQL